MDASTADRQTVDGHIAVVRGVLAALDRGDWTIVDGHPGLEETRRHLPAFRAAFPDLRHSIETAFAAGEMVGCVMSVAGTHRGPFLGMAPTGRPCASCSSGSTASSTDGSSSTGRCRTSSASSSNWERCRRSRR